MIDIIILKTFQRATKKLLKSVDIEKLADILRDNPASGAMIRGSGGIRKLRFATSKGKSGGLRVIYYYQDSKGRIFLITAYPKNEKDNLSQGEVNDLKKLVQHLK